jgi:hypothetical protein
MQTERSSKRIDKSQCHTEFHRWRLKQGGLTPKQGFAVIEAELKEGRHPNKHHPINQPQQEEQLELPTPTPPQ